MDTLRQYLKEMLEIGKVASEMRGSSVDSAQLTKESMSFKRDQNKLTKMKCKHGKRKTITHPRHCGAILKCVLYM